MDLFFCFAHICGCTLQDASAFLFCYPKPSAFFYHIQHRSFPSVNFYGIYKLRPFSSRATHAASCGIFSGNRLIIQIFSLILVLYHCCTLSQGCAFNLQQRKIIQAFHSSFPKRLPMMPAGPSKPHSTYRPSQEHQTAYQGKVSLHLPQSFGRLCRFPMRMDFLHIWRMRCIRRA